MLSQQVVRSFLSFLASLETVGLNCSPSLENNWFPVIAHSYRFATMMQAYRLEKVVGEGSFGKALLCSRKADAKKCIIKQISLGKMSRKEAQQTEQEGKLLARFSHPNIVAFWESFQETSQGKLHLYIVMEYADGGDLSNLIQSRKNRLMSETQVLNITVQIALALKHVGLFSSSQHSG
jgi:serine/threonine protein kinase